MKKLIYLLVLIIPIMSCASTDDQQLQQKKGAGASTVQTTSNGDSATEGADYGIFDFSDVIGKDWKLTAVYISGRDTNFKRSSLPSEFSDAYTLSFDERIASGKAAPNRYTAPYTLGENHAITIGQMATTMMASFIEPENLKEHEFTTYMQNAYAWAEENGNLVLLCKTTDNREVRMLFEL